MGNKYTSFRTEREEERYLRDIIIQLSELSCELKQSNRILKQVLVLLNRPGEIVITLGTPILQ